MGGAGRDRHGARCDRRPRESGWNSGNSRGRTRFRPLILDARYGPSRWRPAVTSGCARAGKRGAFAGAACAPHDGPPVALDPAVSHAACLPVGREGSAPVRCPTSRASCARPLTSRTPPPSTTAASTPRLTHASQATPSAGTPTCTCPCGSHNGPSGPPRSQAPPDAGGPRRHGDRISRWLEPPLLPVRPSRRSARPVAAPAETT